MTGQQVIAPGRVAVVTGAASGIGLALSRRLAAEGMRVVMADVEEPALAAAAGRLDDEGVEVLTVPTDVADPAQVDALRDAALQAFGAVNLLCNNAGVGGSHGPMWEIPRGDLEWVFGVNTWGVVNGIRSFVPVLLQQEAAHILTTASVFGLFAGYLGAYGASKHATVALSEALYFQLRDAGADVGVTVLCPVAISRATGRGGAALTDLEPVRRMYREFTHVGRYERCVVDSSRHSPEKTAQEGGGRRAGAASGPSGRRGRTARRVRRAGVGRQRPPLCAASPGSGCRSGKGLIPPPSIGMACAVM